MMWIDISENYEASSDGHIRNKKTQRILREFVGRDGYLRTQFDGKTRTVHRVIASAFIPVVPGKDYVNHMDGNKQNNNVSNLEWCTFSENLRHAYAAGLKTSRGIHNGRHRLSEDDVSYIRKNYIPRDPTYGGKAMASRFGVAHQTISAVAKGQNWSYEDLEETENGQI